MPCRLKQYLLAAVLTVAASPALAHGMEGVVQPLVIAAAVVGALGGIITGSVGARPGSGLGASIGLLFAALIVYLLIESSGADIFAIIGVMLMLKAFAGVIPLVIVFFVGFFAAGWLRERIGTGEKKSESAP